MDDDDKLQRRKPRPDQSRRARPDPDKLTQGVELVALEYLASAGDPSPRPKALNLSQFEFCLNYLANGFNATSIVGQNGVCFAPASGRRETRAC